MATALKIWEEYRARGLWLIGTASVAWIFSTLLSVSAAVERIDERTADLAEYDERLVAVEVGLRVVSQKLDLIAGVEARLRAVEHQLAAGQRFTRDDGERLAREALACASAGDCAALARLRTELERR